MGSVRDDRTDRKVESVRDDTAVLFGAFCHDLAIGARLQGDDTRPPYERSPLWFAALERGEFSPTFNMATELDDFFGLDPDRDRTLGATLVDLELDPYGELAQSIRGRFGIPRHATSIASPTSAIGGGLSPVATSVDDRDRLLVCGPIVLAGALLALQVAVALWAAGRLADLALPAAAALVSVAVVLMALTLPLLDRGLTVLAAAARDPWSRDAFSTVADLRDVAGLPSPHREAWYQTGEARHLLEAHRASADRYALMTDYAERVAALLVANLVVALGFIVVLPDNGRSVTATAAAIFVGLSIVIAKVSAWRSAGWFERELTVALGLPDPA